MKLHLLAKQTAKQHNNTQFLNSSGDESLPVDKNNQEPKWKWKKKRHNIAFSIQFFAIYFYLQFSVVDSSTCRIHTCSEESSVKTSESLQAL